MKPDRADMQAPVQLARRLGLFDITMIVMGGIIGSGIFMNPYVVARQVHTPLLILGAWLLGGLIALAGSFVYAELAVQRPNVGGQYAYLRDAWHPAVAFAYGWGMLLVIQTGGMAAVAVTFARYFREVSGAAVRDDVLAVVVLAFLTVVNCLGVRAGSTVQNVLMVLKIAAIAMLVVCGLLWAPRAAAGAANAAPADSSGSLLSFGAAMMPVLFAYGGWQTASFVTGELRDPRRDLPRGLLLGVSGVVALYVAVNLVCILALGPEGLALSTAPASDVMRLALGDAGARWIALGIAVSTFGFLSQGMLTAPRLYFAMAGDGLFFGTMARIHPRSRVPVAAIALQGAMASLIAVSGRYEQILSYVVSVDFIFFGLTGACVFIFRARQGIEGSPAHRVPGHPWTTLFFVASCWLVVLATIFRYPLNSAVGIGIMLAGLPVFALWRRK
jgi:basic amino acid/polyamine antiporter, APA family